ncbi:MAG: hypothetical protein IKH38_03650 [Clostridia bacterium]|nr:hypothetical protein [Clostridia bacterium]
MRAVRRFAPLFIAWAFISLMFWGWIFGFLTDAPAANKLTLYADAEVPGAVQLAVLLEEGAGSGIRMAQVHPFTYAMMDSAGLRAADLYLVPEHDVETYRDWFAPLPDELASLAETLDSVDETLGLLAWDPDTRRGLAPEWVAYPQERCWLLLGRESLHTGTRDTEALDAVRRLYERFPAD